MRFQYILVLFLVLVSTMSHLLYAQNNGDFNDFVNHASELRQLVVKLRSFHPLSGRLLSPEEWEENKKLSQVIQEDINNLSDQKNDLFSDGIPKYMVARSFLCGHDKLMENVEVLECINQYLKSCEFPMELECLLDIDFLLRIKRIQQGGYLRSQLLPLFSVNQGSPIEFDKLGADIQWARLMWFPNPPDNNCLVKIANLLKTLGYHNETCYAFMEATCIDPQARVFAMDSKQVLTPLSAVYWYEAADSAYRADEKRLGWNLLMKSAVFSDEETFEKVKKTAALWLYCEENNKPLPPPELFAIPGYHSSNQLTQYGMEEFEKEFGPDFNTRNRNYHELIQNLTWHNPRLRDAMLRRIGEPGLTEKEIRREAWDFIIDAYMKMNAHPRAWALVDEYPDEFEKPQELKKKIQDDWLDLVTPLIQTGKQMKAKSVQVYGQVLLRKESEDESGNTTFSYPVKPLDVTIPWAFPEGSVERAKQELQKALDEFKVKE